MADLRPTTIRESGVTEESQRKARHVYAQALEKLDPQDQWESFNEAGVIARDEWRSSIFRLLTPVTENVQQLAFTFDLNTDKALMRYENGALTGESIGIEQGTTFRIKDGKKTVKEDRKTQLYLGPVRGYFLWPFMLSQRSRQLYAGEEVKNGRLFHKIFVTEGAIAPQKDTDQYIVWIDQTTGQIRMIQFTLRELLGTYRGVVHYDDFRWSQGMYLPFEITLNESFEKNKYSHRFIVQSWAFK